MLISNHSNWLFQLEGDLYITAPKWLTKLQCKYFDHKASWDEYHCDRCYACLEHTEDECGA